MVIADPTQIHQVIMNLCANSLLAMRDTEEFWKRELSEVDEEPPPRAPTSTWTG